MSAVARLRAHERLSLVLSSLVTACTVALPDPRPCVANEDCRDEFGGGSRCLPSGYCAAATLPPRCTRSYPEDLVDDPSRYQERTILATLYSFTDHLDSLRASELAVRLVDARTDARADAEEPRFAMLHCDTTPFAGDALGDLDAIEQLAPFLVRELGVPVLVGARGSARTEAAFRALDTGEAVIVSPSATSPQLTLLEPFVPTDDAPGFLWRTVPPDSLQSAVMAADVLGRGRTRAAILYQTGAYGDALATLFAARVSEAGGVISSFPFDPGNDFSVTIATVGERIAAGDVDEVVFISSDIGDYIDFFVGASASASLSAQYASLAESGEGGIFLADTAYSPRLLTEVGGAADRLFAAVRGTRPAPAEGVVFNAFAAAYSTHYGEDATASAYTSHSYDAAWLAIYGVAWAHAQDGVVTSLGVARGLRRLASGPAFDVVPDTWPEILAAFRSGQSVNLRGASGLLDYDPATEELASPVELWRITETTPGTYGFVRIDLVDPR